jgi:hypothetical protein
LPAIELLVAGKGRRCGFRGLLGLGEVASGDQRVDQEQVQPEEIRTQRHSLCSARRRALVVALAERLVGGLGGRVGIPLQRGAAIGNLGAGARTQNGNEQQRPQRRPYNRLAQVFPAPIAHATSVTPIPLNFNA